MMVLFCHRLVKIDEPSPSLPSLNRYGHVDAASRATLLNRFLEGVFQRVQRTRKPACDLEKPMIDGPNLNHHCTLLPWRMFLSETRHAADHRGAFSLASQSS